MKLLRFVLSVCLRRALLRLERGRSRKRACSTLCTDQALPRPLPPRSPPRPLPPRSPPRPRSPRPRTRPSPRPRPRPRPRPPPPPDCLSRAAATSDSSTFSTTSSGTRRYLIVLPRMYTSGSRKNWSPSCGRSDQARREDGLKHHAEITGAPEDGISWCGGERTRDVQMTSRRLRFIQLSHFSRLPLYVSPLFSSTSCAGAGGAL